MNWARAYSGRIVHLWINDHRTLCGKDLYRMRGDDPGSSSKCPKCQKIFERINNNDPN